MEGISLESSAKREIGPTSFLTVQDIWSLRTNLHLYVSFESLASNTNFFLKAYLFLREFVLGNNNTGLVTKTSSGSVVVIGGVNATLAEDVLPGSEENLYGPGAQISTYVFPAPTRAAWTSFIRTETATPTPTRHV